MSTSNIRYLAAIICICLACNATTTGNNDDGGDNGDGGYVPDPSDLSFDNDAYFYKDPPPRYCGIDGGPPPIVPGGTPECPDDKNREGCPCADANKMDKCWPGPRAKRNLGSCKDGTAICRAGEVTNTWGPCEGFVLPVEGATGKAACQCFSAGQWKLDNLVPCFHGPDLDNLGNDGASSLNQGDTMCKPLDQPRSNWSTDKVTVDCAGHFKLCYTLRAGDGKAPKATDCKLVTVCTESDYSTVDMEQTFPPLPGWKATSAQEKACARSFVTTGGYGEMSVQGKSVTCDEVGDSTGGERVFLRVSYCPLRCNLMGPNGCRNNDGTLKAGECTTTCMNCNANGSGNF